MANLVGLNPSLTISCNPTIMHNRYSQPNRGNNNYNHSDIKSNKVAPRSSCRVISTGMDPEKMKIIGDRGLQELGRSVGAPKSTERDMTIQVVNSRLSLRYAPSMF